MKNRVAVIGLGKMGLMHASIMGMLGNVELVAICEKNSLVRRFGKKVVPQINIVSNVSELRDVNLDAVIVTTPPASHFSIIKAVYEQGIARHVFTEKPLAADYEQSKQLCDMAAAHGGVNMVGYHRRFSVTFRKAKEFLEDEVIGKLISFEAHAYSADFLGARSPKQAIARGGVLEDSGCHIVDMVSWLLGNIEVEGAKVISLIGGGSEDEAYLTVKTKNGLQGELKASWCKEGYRLPEMELTIKGDQGNLTVNEDNVQIDLKDKPSAVWYKHDLHDSAPFSIGGNEYQRQAALFIDALQNGSKAQPDFLTASLVEYVIDRAKDYLKGKNGRE